MNKLDVINEELDRLHEDSDNIIGHMVNKELLDSVEEILALQLTRIQDQLTHLYSTLERCDCRDCTSDAVKDELGDIPEDMYESVEDERID